MVASMERLANRPFGVTMIAFLTVIVALGSLLSLSRARIPEDASPDQVRPIRQHAFWAGTWCALGLVAAAGLFAMRRWGWYATIAFYVAMIPFVLINERLLNPSKSHTFFLIFWLGLAALVLWCLTSRDTRAAFRRRR